MNCDDFLDRLQRALDDRVRPESDRELVRHSIQCENCRGQLDAWRKVSAVLPTASPVVQAACREHAPRIESLPEPIDSPQPRRTSRGTLLALCGFGVAAIWIMAMFRHDGGIESAPSPTSSSPVASLTTSLTTSLPATAATATAAAAPTADVDPEQWWHDVQGRDWVGRTMPTVRSVQEGVAPIGRTLMRAMTILTIGGETHTS